MSVRWTVRAAEDRAPSRRENRVPYAPPKEESFPKGGFPFLHCKGARRTSGTEQASGGCLRPRATKARSPRRESNPLCSTNKAALSCEGAALLVERIKGARRGAVVNDSPVDCQSRGRPSAVEARESNPLCSTKITASIGSRYFYLSCGLGMTSLFNVIKCNAREII